MIVFTAVGCAAVALAVFGLVAHEVGWSWQPMIVLAAFARQLMWAAPVGVVLLALSRRWVGVGVAVVVLTLAVAAQLPLYLGSPKSGDGPGLTMMQANLRLGSADPAHLVHTVADRDVEVLTTVELTDASRDRLIAAGLERLLPYRFDAALPSGSGGLAIWSRYPLSDEVNHPRFELGVLSARITVPSAGAVSVLAVHLLPPYPNAAAEWLTEMTRLRALLADAAGSGRPVVVAGDFNATSDHAQFRRLLGGGYRDAAEEVGAGYLATYPTDRWFPPVIGIDHVLAKSATVTTLSTVALPGSDHRGLLARLRVHA